MSYQINKFVDAYFDQYKKIVDARKDRDKIVLKDTFENSIFGDFFEIAFTLKKQGSPSKIKQKLSITPKIFDDKEERQKKTDIQEEMREYFNTFSKQERREEIIKFINRLQDKIDNYYK